MSLRFLPMLFLGAGCSGAVQDPSADAARQAWLVEALVRDNQIWLSRDLRLLAWKYEAMATDPYDYMRGTAGPWFEDLARARADRVPTAFGSVAEAGEVLLLADPHPENFGTYLPGEVPGPTASDGAWESDELRFEYNDLDGVAFGPWFLDLHRGATALAVLLSASEACDGDCVAAVLTAYGAAYADELVTETPWDPTQSTGFGRLVVDLREEADEEGRERKRLDRESTLDEDGRRWLELDPEVTPEGEGLVAPTVEEAAQVARLAAQLEAEGPAGFRLLDAGRRYGAGISSLPAVRYVFLWDQGDDGPEDDALMNVREVVDPPALPGLTTPVGGLFESQADRVERAPALLWSRPDSDPVLTGLTDGVLTFKATSWTSWNQDWDHEDIVEDLDEGKLDVDDLIGMVEVLGRALAQAHGRAPTASGGDAAAAIAADLAGREDLLAEELVAVGTAEAARTLDDHALFVDALGRYGPLLGADTLADGVGP